MKLSWLSGAKKLALGTMAVALLGGAQGGCADERDPINRIQPMAIPKSLFVNKDTLNQYIDQSDVWYMRGTIVDVPAAQSTGFIGAAGDMSRVRWKIEENRIIAFRDDPDILGTGEAHGGVLASFPILSHFDIKRAYNSSTGEEQNVIEENTSDRPWQQRDYMRVDWAHNELSTAGFAFPGFDSFTAANYFVQDKNSPDHPVFQFGDPNAADPALRDRYVDFTAKYTAAPDTATCYYTYRDFGCGPGDISIRLSFWRVPQRDYVPREYPDRVQLVDDNGDPIRTVSGTAMSLPMMDQFGYFRTERAQYDQRYGTLERRYIYRANQWNIWQQWFQRDDKGNIKKGPDGKELLLPYAERKVRPIVYHVNPEFPAELKPTAFEIAEMWNDAFQETVASLRLLEKRDPGAALTNDELRAEVQAMKARGESAYILCNNPVQQNDRPECGLPGTLARIGDQRYSFMYWVPKPQPSGPLGFGPSYSDPITGELFSAGAYIYGAALDTYSQFATDVVNLLNGKYKEYDFANGIATDLYAKRLKNGEVPGSTGSANPNLPAMPGQPGFNLAKTQAQIDSSVDRPLLRTIKERGVPVAAGGSVRDRLELIKGSALEKKILDNPETRMLAGKTKDSILNDAEMDQVRQILHSGFTHEERDRYKVLAGFDANRRQYLASHGCYYAQEFADDSTLGLAREMAKKYNLTGGTPAEQEGVQKQIWNEMRQHILRGVLAHEVGHTLGLRHNYEGSSDSLNFFDDFWTIKGNTPQFGAPMTEDEKNKKLYEFQYTTVMDYGARFNTDIHGIGKYDYAAIRFGYGNIVEAWPNGKVKDPLYNSTPTDFGGVNLFTGYSAEILDDLNRDYRHYTQIPGEFTDGIESLKKGGRQYRAFGDVYEAARQQFLAAGDKVAITKTTSAKGGIDIVPYHYCGDEFAGSANRPLCNQWDAGMDPFEVVQDAMSRYRQYYLFDAFTNGRVTGISKLRGYLGRIYTRYFSHVHNQYIHWLFYQGSQDYYWTNILNGNGDAVGRGWVQNPDWFKDPGGGLTNTLATSWGLDRLIDALSTPDVGVYQPDTTNWNGNVLTQVAYSPFACSASDGNPTRCGNSATQLTLDIDQGARYRFTRYDGASGQAYFTRIKNVGSFYDKIAALIALTNSETNFVGTDQTNAVSYLIGFYLAYPKALSTTLGGLVTDHFDTYAWRYQYDDAGKQIKLMTPDLIQAFGGKGAFFTGGDTIPTLQALQGKPVDSGWYFFYKAYALYFSMALFQSNFSQSWNDNVRVWCLGCGESYTPGAGTTTLTFTDPLSKKQYAAIDAGDGRFSPGAELIRRGQQLVQTLADKNALPPNAKDRDVQIARATSDLSDHIEMLDLVRGLYDTYGYTRW